jgi:hypothetical protein
MDSHDSHDFDEDLETIKAFHTFLTEIIDNGYNNDKDIIKKIAKYINKYIDDDTESSSTKSDSSEDENEELNNKIQNKIDKFMMSNNDLSKIYLYKKNNIFISTMNEFINNTFKY